MYQVTNNNNHYQESLYGYSLGEFLLVFEGDSGIRPRAAYAEPHA
jgi:hypothetical protein